MKFTITNSDLKRNKILEPNWYAVKITKVEERQARDGESMNLWVSFEVTSQDDATNGVPLRRCFSEKAPGFILNFVYALTGKKVETEQEIAVTEACIGRQLKVYVNQEGQFSNNVTDFLPL
jgi:hypothetical protein